MCFGPPFHKTNSPHENCWHCFWYKTQIYNQKVFDGWDLWVCKRWHQYWVNECNLLTCAFFFILKWFQFKISGQLFTFGLIWSHITRNCCDVRMKQECITVPFPRQTIQLYLFWHMFDQLSEDGSSVHLKSCKWSSIHHRRWYKGFWLTTQHPQSKTELELAKPLLQWELMTFVNALPLKRKGK